MTEPALADIATRRQPGFFAYVRRSAKLGENGVLLVPPEEYTFAVKTFPRIGTSPVVETPTLAELASRFSDAVLRWGKAGFPVVTEFAYRTRSAICDACPHWQPNARAGLGKCAAPGCGCTSLKRWLATEKCPLGKWPSATVDTAPNDNGP